MLIAVDRNTIGTYNLFYINHKDVKLSGIIFIRVVKWMQTPPLMDISSIKVEYMCSREHYKGDDYYEYVYDSAMDYLFYDLLLYRMVL